MRRRNTPDNSAQLNTYIRAVTGTMIALVIAVFIIVRPANADSVSTINADGILGIAGLVTIDVFPGAPFITNDGSGVETRAVISFDLSDATITDGFDTATLNLNYSTQPTAGPASWDIYSYTKTTGDFTTDDFPLGVLASGSIAVPDSTDGLISIDVTAILTAAVASSDIFPFLAFNIHGATITTDSQLDDPYLELTSLTPIPLPAALPLFLVGLAAMGAVAGRRNSGHKRSA